MQDGQAIEHVVSQIVGVRPDKRSYESLRHRSHESRHRRSRLPGSASSCQLHPAGVDTRKVVSSHAPDTRQLTDASYMAGTGGLCTATSGRGSAGWTPTSRPQSGLLPGPGPARSEWLHSATGCRRQREDGYPEHATRGAAPSRKAMASSKLPTSRWSRPVQPTTVGAARSPAPARHCRGAGLARPSSASTRAPAAQAGMRAG